MILCVYIIMVYNVKIYTYHIISSDPDLGVEHAIVIVCVFAQFLGIASNCWEWMVFRLQAGREQIAEMIKEGGGRAKKFRWECA